MNACRHDRNSDDHCRGCEGDLGAEIERQRAEIERQRELILAIRVRLGLGVGDGRSLLEALEAALQTAFNTGADTAAHQ